MKGEATFTILDKDGKLKKQFTERNKVFDIFGVEINKFLKYIEIATENATNTSRSASMYKPTKEDFKGINLFDVNLDENCGFLSEIPIYWASTDTAAPLNKKGQYNGIPEETVNSVKRKWTFKIQENTELKAIALRGYYNNRCNGDNGQGLLYRASAFIQINATQFINKCGNIYKIGYVDRVPLMQTSKRFLKVASLNDDKETLVYILPDKSKILIFCKDGTVKIYDNNENIATTTPNVKVLSPKALPGGYNATVYFNYIVKHPTTGKYYVFYHHKRAAPYKVMLYGLDENFDYDSNDIEFDCLNSASLENLLPRPNTSHDSCNIINNGLFSHSSGYSKIDFANGILKNVSTGEPFLYEDYKTLSITNSINSYDFYEDCVGSFSYDTTGKDSISYGGTDIFPDFYPNSRIITQKTNTDFQLSTVLNLPTPIELFAGDSLSIEYKITVN